jgi:hypothetical protein
MTEAEWQDIVCGLREIDANVAAAAAEQLHTQSTTEDLDRLLKLLDDDDFFLREAAAWPLSEIAGPSSLRELLNAYQRGFDEGHDNDGFTTALVELATADPSGCRQVLERLAESESAQLRENAFWLLSFCEPKPNS